MHSDEPHKNRKFSRKQLLLRCFTQKITWSDKGMQGYSLYGIKVWDFFISEL